MGGSLVSYLGAALPAPPAAWGLHSADVVDPKVPLHRVFRFIYTGLYLV